MSDTMTQEITNSEDIIDSRDIIERIAALEAETKVIKEELEQDAGSEFRLEDAETELMALKKLHEDGKDTFGSEWEYGVTLVRDSYFGDYAQEQAMSLGLIQDDMHWPATCIDWERAARELQMDYTTIDFDGVEYWGQA